MAIVVILGIAIVALVFNLQAKNKLPKIKKEPANISVSEPKTKATVSLPFAIKGSARVFESVVNVRIYEEKNKEIIYEDVAYAKAPDIGQFGDFEITIDYLIKRPTTNQVIAETYWTSPKDGSPMDIVRIPLVLNLDNTQNISLFFSKTLGADTDCSKVYPVARVIAQKDNVSNLLRTTLELLIKGPRFVEQGEEYASAIDATIKIKDLVIKDGSAKISFDKKITGKDAQACEEKTATSQIIKTATQFSSIKRVEIK